MHATLTPAEQTLLEDYRAFVERAYRDDFGVTNAQQASQVAVEWFQVDHTALHASEPDEHFAEVARVPGARRVLDLASGMGTAALRGAVRGFEMHGVEPDAEKLSLMSRRVATLAEAGFSGMTTRPPRAIQVVRAVGERLPYKADVFDAVVSYQTLEHVQDVEAVLAEMLRVVRPGGIIHLRCPDYRGTYEGHYLLPWLPLMPRAAARLYLRLRGRPTAGFAGIVYTTRPRLVRGLKDAAARAGMSIEVKDLERERVSARLKSKGLPSSALFVTLAKAALSMKRAFRAETHINLCVFKQPG
jgi:SAM-dependent methyltransferase